jgi:hypothetical protein
MKRRQVGIKAVAGGVQVHLDRGLVDFLVQFPVVLDSIRRGSDDPASRRLHVPVYLDDSAGNDEWWGFMASELDQSRAADRSAFVEALRASAEGTVLSIAEAHAVVRVLVESRLALAARLGVETEEDYERLGDTENAMLAVLGEMQMAFLVALQPR